jgi:hypothetical protein
VGGARTQVGAGHVYWVRVVDDSPRAIEILKARQEVLEASAVDGQIKLTLASQDTDPSFIADTMVRNGFKLTGLWEDELGLEEVFLRVTKGETQ